MLKVIEYKKGIDIILTLDPKGTCLKTDILLENNKYINRIVGTILTEAGRLHSVILHVVKEKQRLVLV